jgi:tetratricopeptide (TPR) repeat protein
MIKASTNTEKMEDEAIRLLESGKLRRAERVLKGLLANDPDSLAAHFNLARVYWSTEEYECALLHARRTLRLNPKEPNACLNLGLIYEFMRRDKLASHYYKRELSRDPGSTETLFNIGRLYFNNHRWLRASKYLRRCFDLGNLFRVEDTVYKLGECYCKLYDLQSFIDIYKRYLQMVPNAAWAAANLGGALLRAKDYRHAVLWLSRAKQLGVKHSVDVDLARAKKMVMKGSM